MTTDSLIEKLEALKQDNPKLGSYGYSRDKSIFNEAISDAILAIRQHGTSSEISVVDKLDELIELVIEDTLFIASGTPKGKSKDPDKRVRKLRDEIASAYKPVSGNHRGVAQGSEQDAHNVPVDGSIPSSPTTQQPVELSPPVAWMVCYSINPKVQEDKLFLTEQEAKNYLAELKENGWLRCDYFPLYFDRPPERESLYPAARKLVWELSGETDVCADKEIAEISVLGSHSGKMARYGVRYDRHSNAWQVCFWCGNIGMWSAYRLASEEEAKAAAQEHYNSIIRENTQIEGGATDANS